MKHVRHQSYPAVFYVQNLTEHLVEMIQFVPKLRPPDKGRYLANDKYKI